ncbi:MAG: STT3 domain-containing protein [Candidatus Hadarchaeum sp.]|uniref:STT3 domain-containing protein n=1 Tax=Candidatus Hadarchaeum sp. TaxID=2883567 RepID=UPI003D14D2F2
MNYRRWLIVAYLVSMMVLSVTILMVPGEKHDTLTTSDSGWVYNVAVEILNKGTLVDNNPLSHAPYGLPVSFNEQLQPLLAVMLYQGVHAVDPSVTLMDVVKFWGPLMFALSLIPVFLIGRELGGDVAGAAAVFFAATMTDTIYWMKVGSFDRDCLVNLLTLTAAFFTIKVFKASKGDFLKQAVLAGLSFGLFSLAWAGSLYFAAVPLGGVILLLLFRFFERLVRRFSDVFGAFKSTLRDHLWPIVGVIIMLSVMSVIYVILGKQRPDFWVGYFQMLLGYLKIGGSSGVTLPTYATEARAAGPITETLSVFYNNGILTVFMVLMFALALAKFFWSRKNWEILVIAWLVVLVAMVYPGVGPARFVRQWWPLVPVLTGVGFAALLKLIQRAYFYPSVGRWLKEAENPILVGALVVVFVSPFVVNAYNYAGATVPPPEWYGQQGLDQGLIEASSWLKTNTAENSVVAVEWSYGHLVAAAARRPTVVDGAEILGEMGKWENELGVKPPDYIYTVNDSTGTFLRQHYTINGRRTDIQRFPGLDASELAFYLETYRDNYGVRIDYLILHAYQYLSMLDTVAGDSGEKSQRVTLEDNYLVFHFASENILFSFDDFKAFARGDGENRYCAGVVIFYYSQTGDLTNFRFNFWENVQIPRVLRIYLPSWTNTPSLDQILAFLGEPYYTSPPLYARVYGGYAPLPDYLSLAYLSGNGIVAVLKVNHTASPIYPTGGSLINDSTPEFRWTSGIGATRYEFVLARDENFSSVVVQAETTQPSYTPAVVLADGSYWWRVAAYKEEKLLGWSEAASFTLDTAPPVAPQLIEPQEGAVFSQFELTFRWSPSEPGARYQVQVYNEADPGQLLVDNLLEAENLAFTFQNNGVYVWRVRAIDSAGNQSSWSQGRFTIRLPPQPPTLVSPEKDGSVNTAQPTFRWSGGVADNFRIVVDDDPNFGSPEIFFTLGLVRSYTAPEPLPDGTYHWKVVSVVGSQLASSPVWTLTIDTIPPEAPEPLAPSNHATLTENRPTFSWSSVLGAASYRLVLDNDQDFSSPMLDNLTSATSLTLPFDLSPGSYYWKVYALDQAGNENASPVWTLTVGGG